MILARSRRLAETSTAPFARQLYETSLDITAQRTTGSSPAPGDVMSAWAGVRRHRDRDVPGLRRVGDGREERVELTRREREIGLLIADGLSNRQIAARLYLSVRTVESHVFQARSKTGAPTRAALGAMISRARRAGDATGT